MITIAVRSQTGARFYGTIDPKAYDLCRWVDDDPGEDDKASCGTFSQSFGSTNDRYAFQYHCFDIAGNCVQDRPADDVFTLSTALIKKGTVKMRFYQECDQDVPFKQGTQIDQDFTYIFDQRRALRDPTDTFLYRYQGRYNDTLNLWDRYKLNSCAGNEDCDTALDEQAIASPTDPIPAVCR